MNHTESSYLKNFFLKERTFWYLLVVILSELLVLLHDLMQPGLHLLLAISQRVTVTVQQSIHVGAFHHLNQDWSQFPFQSQQTLQPKPHILRPITIIKNLQSSKHLRILTFNRPILSY